MPQDRVPEMQARVAAGAQLPVTALDRTRTNDARRPASSRRSTTRSTRRPAPCAPRRASRTRGGALFPNQFVNVHLLLRTIDGAVVVPVTAVRHGADRRLRLRAQRRPHGDAARRSTRGVGDRRRDRDHDGPAGRRARRHRRRRPPADGARVQLAEPTGRRRPRRARGERPARRRRRARSGERAARAGAARRRRRARRRRAADASGAHGVTGDLPMSPSRPFILRPVATSLLMLAIVLAGLVGFRFLPLSALPQVDYPTIQVQTLYPGASPEVMATPSPRRSSASSARCPGLDAHELDQRGRRLDRHAAVRLGLTLDVAEQEVQAAINAGGSLLPADLPAPPVYAKVNPADAPVLTLAITLRHAAADRGAEPRQHAAGAEDQPGVGRRPGHARAAASGRRCASRPTRRRWPRTASASTRCAPRSPPANANSAKGSFDGPTRAYTINANDQLLTAADYQNLIVAYRNGAPVRLVERRAGGRERRERRGSAPGPASSGAAAARRSSSTCSASPAPT